MLSIRLTRGGSKKRPVYDIVVAEKSFSRDGRFVETLGYSNPLIKAEADRLRVNLERYDYWFSQGAAPTDTVKRLVKTYRKQSAAAGKDAENDKTAKATKAAEAGKGDKAAKVAKADKGKQSDAQS